MQIHANRGEGGEVMLVQTFTCKLFLIKYLVHKLLGIIAKLFVSFSKVPVLLYFFVLFMIKLNRWIPSKKKAAFMRINIWIYTKISMPIFITTKLLLIKVRGIQQNIFFPISLVSSISRPIMKMVKYWIMKLYRFA